MLLDVHSDMFEEARGEISAYAELEKSPEHMHTYRINPLSLWNAASAGWGSAAVESSLERWSRFAVPDNVIAQIQDILNRWGKLRLRPMEGKNSATPKLRLETDDTQIFEELRARKSLQKWLTSDGESFLVQLINRGTVKSELIRIGYPVLDLVPFKEGEPLEISLRKFTTDGKPLVIRDYQKNAMRSFIGTRKPGTGFGTIVMPCGSGKTMVGMSVMAELGMRTLILGTNVTAVHQWRNELLDKTNLEPNQIGEYTGDRKIIRPVTIATYQILAWRKQKAGPFPHFDLFRNFPWGLIIYDEVHLLPAPIFRITAELQTIRRLGLTATLIREDGAERDIFSLVGPKRFDIPWKELEASGWIAEAHCHELRINLPKESHIPYAMAGKRSRIRLAAENPRKIDITLQLVKNRSEDQILVIGQYIAQLKNIARRLNVPIITGKTPNKERERIYDRFKRGRERIIVVSKVANFAIDLPDASVAIQVSGSFGSRQEEAQRLGRILRPKKKHSWLYSLVSRGTVEEDFADNRQRFLTEQGYLYTIDIWED